MGLTQKLGTIPLAIFTDASNNVGIGISTPAASLHVAGAITSAPAANGVLMGIESNYAVIHLNGTSGTGSLIDFSTSGTDYKGRIEYDNTSNWMRFGTNGAERMRITSGGNIGIGTSSFSGWPAGNLVLKTQQASGISVIQAVSGDSGSAICLYSGASSSDHPSIISLRDMRFGTASDLGTGGYNERMRIRSDGNVAIGDSGNASVRLVVQGANTSSSNFTFVGYNGSSTTLFALRNDGAVFINSFTYNNTVTGGTRNVFIDSSFALGGISSIRASKTNIEPITNNDWIYQLEPVTFNYRKKDEEGNYTEEYFDEITYGLIAEDTAPIADFLINYNDKEDGTKEMVGIEYSRLITPLIKAIQDLNAKVSALENK